MKILIADDCPSRYVPLIEKLNSMGISRSCIELVQSANDARKAVENCKFDLLVLDILLPNFPEDEPDSQYSMDFLYELCHGDSENQLLPSHIIGITEDQEEHSEKIELFESLTWTIIKYIRSSEEWVNQIVGCVRYLQELLNQQNSADPVYGIDLLIVCALRTPELEEVLKIPWSWTEARPIDESTFVHFGEAKVREREISVCAAYATRMGMVSAAILSTKLISKLRPRCIVMCGICAGVEGKVNIGDVLLADPAWDFQSGKRVRDKDNASFSIAPHQIQPNEAIRAHISELSRDKHFLSRLVAESEGVNVQVPEIHIGPVASGSAVLADGNVIDSIKEQHRSLLGVEMEIYGVYAAAISSANPQPLFFALKSVCDFADSKKGDDYQRYASYTSANVLRELIERYGDKLI